MLAVKAESMPLRDREWKMYWTPAPPKWDMAPSYVKQVLFPDYHGAEFNIDRSIISRNMHVGLVGDEETDTEKAVKLRCHLEVNFCRSQAVIIKTVVIFGIMWKSYSWCIEYEWEFSVLQFL